MKNYIQKNIFYILTVLGVCVTIYTAVSWTSISVLQRMLGLFFGGLILHVWEESKYPGGFTEMITKKLNFTQTNPHFGEFVTATYILIIVFVPLFFPKIIFLTMSALLLGVLETIAHIIAIKIYDKSKSYSPGLLTAITILLPISAYSIWYASSNNLMTPIEWVYSVLYLLAGLMLAQQIVVRTSGMKYTDFLKNVKQAFFSNKK